MLNPRDFDYIAKLVKDEAGISLEKGKEYLVLARVEPVAKNLGFPDIAALVVHLRKANDFEQRRQIIESLTTHETSFFRDQAPFEVLKNQIFPTLIKQRQSTRELTIWCGAASSGQEPYSVCMLLRENFPELLQWKIKFIATDVSTTILERARSGTYSQIEINRGLPIRLLTTYFDKVGDSWIIKPAIREMVKFEELNLLQDFTKFPDCDLIMLRNVLIYFETPTKRQILGRIKKVLKPDGYLLLGTAETTLQVSDDFERVAFGLTTFYKRKG